MSGKRRIWMAVVAVVAGGTPALPGPAAAATSQSAGGAPAADADARAARSVAIGARVAGIRGRAVEAAGSAPVQVAAEGDGLAIADPVDISNPRGDIRSVLVGTAGGASLVFTMQVEEYTNPTLDPAWIEGFTGAFWYVDTSGDAVPELLVGYFHDGEKVVAALFDATSGVLVCDRGAPSTDAATKSYTVTLSTACFGDVKRPAAAGIFFYDPLPSGSALASDFAPNSGSLVRFNRPGQSSVGYAVVTRSAGFRRLGTYPVGATPSGTFQDYDGPRPVVDAASARPYDEGLWSVTDDGEVSTQDRAEFYGDATNLALSRPVVGMAVLPDRSGYWLVASDGGIFAYGDAGFFGSTGGVRLNSPIVGMAATPSGQGYWLVAADGGIFAYGDARFFGSTGATRLNRPVVGMAAGYQGQGYWLVASDGGIFAFGLPFYGSTGGITLQQPITGMAATRSGGGYRFIARDGGVFSFGDADFVGSAAQPGRTDVVGLATL